MVTAYFLPAGDGWIKAAALRDFRASVSEFFIGEMPIAKSPLE